MKDRLRNDPTHLQPCRPQGSHSIPMLRVSWKQLSGVVTRLLGQDKMLQGCLTADSCGATLHSGLPMVTPGCSSSTAHILANAMLSPAPPPPPQKQPQGQLAATYIMAK